MGGQKMKDYQQIAQFLSISEFAARINVPAPTLRRWDSNGWLRPHHKSPTGTRFYTEEQAQAQFGFLLTAFKYGVPPHAGLAYGLDRLVMLMAKEDSIRDVIAFPKVKDASDLMTEAPARVTKEQLDELGIAVVAEEEEE